MYNHNFDTVTDFIQNEAFKSWVLHATPELDSHWSNWLAQNPEKAETVARAREMILRFDFEQNSVAQGRKEEIYQKIISETKNGTVITKEKTNQKVVVWLPTALKAVAASVSLLLIGWFFSNILQQQKQEGSFETQVEIEWVERNIGYGKKLNLTLSDGTMVKLNAGSSLRFPKQFSGSVREVYLEGEAYFDVRKDSSKAFIVKTGEVATKVLGTRFNVRENNANNTVEVAVEEGKVSVSSEQVSNEAILQPNEQAVYSVSEQVLEKGVVDVADIVAWKDGTIIFRKASLEEMVDVLSRWYGYDFQVVGRETVERKFSGEFHNKTIDNVLSKLAYSSSFNYKLDHEKKTVAIMPR